jgi:hypothetical protein
VLHELRSLLQETRETAAKPITNDSEPRRRSSTTNVVTLRCHLRDARTFEPTMRIEKRLDYTA